MRHTKSLEHTVKGSKAPQYRFEVAPQRMWKFAGLLTVTRAAQDEASALTLHTGHVHNTRTFMSQRTPIYAPKSGP